MAIFRDGIKIGKFDIRGSLTKKRTDGILRQIGIKEQPKKAMRPSGEIDAIRSMVGKSEGFMMPVNFKVTFNVPAGIQQPSLNNPDEKADSNWDIIQRPPMAKKKKNPYSPGSQSGSTVKGGSLDWQSHIMQGSTGKAMAAYFKDEVNIVHETKYTPFKTEQKGSLLGSASSALGFSGLGPPIGDTQEGGPGGGGMRSVRKLDLYCSKVTIPEKTFNVGLYRTYGAPYPYPQSVQFGTLTTTFYCDGAMIIKKFFDKWQKLIWNDMTGNFNYYDEYVSEFDIFTRSSVVLRQQPPRANQAKAGARSFPGNISSMIKEATAAFDKFTGQPDPPKDGKPAPKTIFADTYGVRVFQCWPQTVGSIDLAHDATDQIGTFDVTWAYTKWNPFKMGDIGNRSTVSLSVGEFRNEKDGFPFLEDLPPELSGPLTGALGQAVTTGPLSKFSGLLG